MIDPALDAAFRATAYRVSGREGTRFTIRIDSRCAALDEVLLSAGTTNWAYITACNPRSQRLCDAENADRMADLEAVVRERGLDLLRGEAVADASDWPVEPGLLVLGITESDAVQIARGYAQHAVVIGYLGEPARLVWT